MPEKDVQKLLKYLGLESQSDITKEVIMSEVRRKLPEEFCLAEPLEPLQNLERMGLSVNYAIDNKEKLGLTELELIVVSTQAAGLVLTTRAFQPEVGKALNEVGDAILAGHGEKYTNKAVKLCNELPAYIEAILEKSRPCKLISY